MDACVLPALQGSLETGAAPLSLGLERVPWLDMDWEGSHGLTVLSISEQEAQRTGEMSGLSWLCLRVCVLPSVSLSSQTVGRAGNDVPNP